MPDDVVCLYFCFYDIGTYLVNDFISVSIPSDCYYLKLNWISACHHWCCEFESRSGRGEQHNVIKFVSDLREVGGFLRVLVSSTNKTDRHDITEELLKVALSTIKETNTILL